MKPLDRNISILEHIVGYCDQIEETIRRFGNDYGVFSTDAIYRNAAALCVLQIGELAGKLTDEFRAEHPGAPWRQIRGMRNIVAHSYGTGDHLGNSDGGYSKAESILLPYYQCQM